MPPPLKLRIKFTGLCLFVHDLQQDGSRVTVLLPDARHTGGPPRIPDGTHPDPHVGYLQWDLRNDECRPAHGEGHYFFDGTEVEFDQEDASAEVGNLDTVANFSRIWSGSRVPASFLDGTSAFARGGPGDQNLPDPPSPVLARIRLTSGQFLPVPQHFLSGPCAFSSQLWDEGPGPQQYWPELAHSVLWQSDDLESDAVTIRLSGKDGEDRLVLVPENGDRVVQITVANLCRDTPVATSIRGDRSQEGNKQRVPHGWDYHLDRLVGGPMTGPDHDFVWYYKLLYEGRPEEKLLQERLFGFRLPIPYPSLPRGEAAAHGSAAGVGGGLTGLIRGHSRQCFLASTGP